MCQRPPPTVCKTRYIAGHQQICASTRSIRAPRRRRGEAALLAAPAGAAGCRRGDPVRLRQGRAGAEGSGGDRAGAAAGIPVYVDPKSEDFPRYRGATCITPNQPSWRWRRACRSAATRDRRRRDQGHARGRGGGDPRDPSDKGMVLVEASGAAHLEPARAREVYDVSGAGDTVIAVLALAQPAATRCRRRCASPIPPPGSSSASSAPRPSNSTN